MKKDSLVIYLPSLASGGVERLFIGLAPLFVEAGFDVTFLLHRLEGSFASALPREVRLATLECNRTWGALLPLMRFLRREQPDILISGLPHNNMISLWARLLARSSVRTIVCQQNTLSMESTFKKNFTYRIMPLLYRIFLRQADGIVASSDGVAKDLIAKMKLPRERIIVIHNAIVFPNFEKQMNAPVEHIWLQGDGPPVILGIGRLVEQKDFITLIMAFARLARQRNVRLIILGEGPLRASLLTLAERLGVADRVSLAGFQKNPLPFMRRAAVLVMSSRYEGFGNVVAEALACGTPVVSTDCPHGPAEILEQGRYGRLVPVGDADAMAQAIGETLDQPLPSGHLRHRGYEFTAQRAATAYMNLFNALLAEESADEQYRRDAA
ncbi:MAG: glycosyltransferase [Alphaproteobacteria bacterium]|nr:glycosyltransferase [Alphaproteobacteria bacterium]